MEFFLLKIIIKLIPLFNLVQSYLPCKAGLNIKHGILINCTTRLGYEYAFIKCDLGYEFETNILAKEIFLDPQDNYLTDPLQCNGSINYCLFLSNYYLIVLLIAIGCPLKYIPKDKDLESDPMTIVKTVCVPATLKDHCLPKRILYIFNFN